MRYRIFDHAQQRYPDSATSGTRGAILSGINGLVNFEGESVKELTEAFHEAVDDYLAYMHKTESR